MDYWTSGEAQQVDLGNVEINKAEKARHCNWRAGSALLTLLFIQISEILPCSSPRDVRTLPAVWMIIRRAGGVCLTCKFSVDCLIVHLSDLNI